MWTLFYDISNVCDRLILTFLAWRLPKIEFVNIIEFSSILIWWCNLINNMIIDRMIIDKYIYKCVYINVYNF